jgi:hypothetical protein
LKVIETARLTLRWLTADDAAFIVVLLNDPSWLRFIGDKGVRTEDDARRYILNGPIKMYGQYGFGLFLTELKNARVPIGLCGLIKREGLTDVDVGFAFLPEYRKNGYALESAAAVIAHGESVRESAHGRDHRARQPRFGAAARNAGATVRAQRPASQRPRGNQPLRARHRTAQRAELRSRDAALIAPAERPNVYWAAKQ